MTGRGAHRRTAKAWERLRAALYAAQSAVLELEQLLTAERRLRAQADSMVGDLVTRAEDAESRAAAAERALTIERERMRQAGELIAGLRDQLRAPKPSPAADETQELRRPVVVPLGSPSWHAARAS